MPRKPRRHIDGAVYHVMLRGNAGQAIFADDADRLRFEALLAEGVARHGHRVLAYCWMGNHAHLCLRVAESPLSRIVQQLAFRYARAFNRRHRRVGHVFQGRFRALLVGDDSYRLELLRYIHRNPVTAGLTRDAQRYRWSSHGALSGARRPPDWLDCAETWALFAREPGLARRRLHAFVMETGGGRAAADGPGLWAEIEAAIAAPSVATLGKPPRAPRREQVRPPSLAAVIDAAARVAGVERRALVGPTRARAASRARGLAGLLARATGAASLSALARATKRDPGSISRAVEAARLAVAADRGLARRLAAARRALAATTQ
jgi:REP element-mobilizing transposase RayT